MSSERSVRRCWHCNLNQFSSITCRRCHELLEQPVEKEVATGVSAEPYTPEPHQETVATRIAHQIRKARTAKGLTQERLAEVLDCSRMYISKVESGNILPRIETLERVSKAIGINVLDLIQSKKEIQTRLIFDDLFLCELLEAGKGMPVLFWKKTAEAAGRLSNVR